MSDNKVSNSKTNTALDTKIKVEISEDVDIGPTALTEVKIDTEVTCSKPKRARKSSSTDYGDDCTPTAKRYHHRDEHTLNNYNKKQILKYLDENGCTQRNFENAIKNYKVDKKLAADFFNQHIEKTEKNVIDECHSVCFENNEKWLKIYKDLQVDSYCRYEQAAIITMIEKNEDLPPPEELNGVDLKACYGFLRRALYGLPQPETDPITASFLAREFQFVISAANNASSDAEVLKIINYLKEQNTVNVKKSDCFDPLNLESLYDKSE